ncbi:glycosyl transferase family 1 [Acidobacteria bacterium Mor1]|nr:glycosyl transferase family 1 [Acidobacteria bacterium Mor1]
MRVVYLHQYFNTPKEEGGTRSYELARRLVERGHQVHMITSRRDAEAKRGGWEQSDIDGIDVHRITVPYNNKMGAAGRIRAFLRFSVLAGLKAMSFDADVVFATSTPLTIVIPGLFASKRRRKPMVFEVRDLWPEIPIAVGALKNPLMIAAARRLEKIAYNNSFAVVALSPGMAEGVAAVGYPQERIFTIPNGCDRELFHVPAERGAAFRQAHPWLGDRPLVLYAGTVGHVNGLDYMVQLAEHVGPIDPEVRFLVVGTGKEEARIRRLAEERGVLDKSFFMLPAVSKTEMPDLLSAATLSTSFVIDIPEMRHNSANKFFDSIAAGRPVAINHEGWLADLIRRRELGLVMPAGAPDRAAAGLVDLLRDAPRLEKMSRAGVEASKTLFDRDRLGAQLERVLRAAAERANLPDPGELAEVTGER